MSNEQKRQTVILTNNTKQNISDLNSDVIIKFPSKIFYKKPTNIQLMNINIKIDITLFGYTNNYCIVEVDNVKYNIVIEYNPTIETDSDFATALQNALNAETYTNDIVFEVKSTAVEIIMTNIEPERDDSTVVFSISANRTFTAFFNHKDSFGPIIGVGNSTYNNVTNIEGHAVNSITTYNYISSVNISKGTLTYPEYDDLNCKMILYDSSNNIIPNTTNPGTDTTISINSSTIVNYRNISELLIVIENAMNAYSTNFTPAATFVITYDYNENKVTIANITGAKFGISFNINRDGGLTTTGSLHRILGFDQKRYLGLTTITSVKPSFSYDNIFPEDYVLVCSDLISKNIDVSPIGIGAGDNIKNSQVLFAIPLSQINNFIPISERVYTIDIKSSPYSLKYENEEYNDATSVDINFYLRLLSGRHIKGSSQWSAQLSFGFNNVN